MQVEGPFRTLAERETVVWLSAVVLYGVGDTVTTYAGLTVGGIAEAGPIAAPLMAAHGQVALLAIKAATFALFYLAWRHLRTPGRVAVPFALATVGGVVTLWNLVVIAGAM